jgi:hypothetical protein
MIPFMHFPSPMAFNTICGGLGFCRSSVPDQNNLREPDETERILWPPV